MAKTKKIAKQDITLSKNWQILFIASSTAAWLAGFTFFLFYWPGNFFRWETILSILLPAVLPLLFFVVSLAFVWRTYTTTLHKLFTAFMLTTVGFGFLIAAQSIEMALRTRFYPPVFENVGSEGPGFFTMFGHELLVDGIGLAVFAGALLWFKRRSRRS